MKASCPITTKSAGQRGEGNLIRERNLLKDRNVEYLNRTVWATIKPSAVHGIGVFAIRNIPKGTCIGASDGFFDSPITISDINGLHPAILAIIKQRWPRALLGEPFLSPNCDARLVSFMNHGEPNYDPMTDTVTCDVNEGQEILEDYRTIPNYKEIYPFIQT